MALLQESGSRENLTVLAPSLLCNQMETTLGLMRVIYREKTHRSAKADGFGTPAGRRSGRARVPAGRAQDAFGRFSAQHRLS